MRNSSWGLSQFKATNDYAWPWPGFKPDNLVEFNYPSWVDYMWGFNPQTLGEAIAFLKKVSWWWEPLKPGTKVLVGNLLTGRKWAPSQELSSILNKRVKVERFRNLCNHVDGQILSILLGNPEVPRSWDELSHLTLSLIGLFSNDLRYGSRLKAEKKWYRKALLEDGILLSAKTDFWWLHKELQYAYENKQNKSLMYSVATLTQTRNCGLPPKEVLDDSLQKWRKCILSEDREVIPPDYIEENINNYVNRYGFNIETAIRRAKLLFSTKGEFDFPRKLGGKCAALKSIIGDRSPIYAVDLNNGQLTNRQIFVEDLGNYIFHKCIQMYTPKDLAVRLSAVFEPGFKVRCITVSKIIHAEILSPLGKILLEIMSQYPECQSGVSASRHGWNAMKDLTPSKPGLSWMFYGERNLRILSSDLEEATDSVEFVISEKIIRTWGGILQLPSFYIDLVVDIFCTGRPVYYKGMPIGITKRGALMGDPLTKAILTSLHIIAFEEAKKVSDFLWSNWVGDDLVSIAIGDSPLLRQIESLKELYMKVSEKDTYISSQWANYSEEFLRIPENRYNCFDFAIKTNFWGRVPYVDYPRIRLILPVQTNQDMKMSASMEGKYLLTAREVRWAPKGTYGYLGLALASLFQNYYLEDFADQNPYMPTIFGGQGKLPEFGTLNYFNYLEWSNTSEKMLRYEATIASDVVLLFSNRRTLATFTTRHMIPFGMRRNKHLRLDRWQRRIKSSAFPPEVQELLVATRQQAYDLGQFYPRLTSVYETEDSLFIELEAQKKYREMILGDAQDEPEETLEELILEDVLVDKHPQDIRRTMEKFFEICERHSRFLKEVRISPLYQREARDIIHEIYGLHVDIPCFLPNFEVGRELSLMERENILIKEWFDGGMITPPPLYTVDDDDVIASDAKASDKSYIIICTDDVELCKRCSAFCLMVIRIPMRAWCEAWFFLNEDLEEAIIRIFDEYGVDYETPLDPVVDMGSFSAYEEKFFVDGIHNLRGVGDITWDQSQVENLDIELSPNQGFPESCFWYNPSYRIMRKWR
jgi:hypothetical protein